MTSRAPLAMLPVAPQIVLLSLLASCSEPYEPASGSFVLEVADGEAAEGMSMFFALAGDSEETVLLTDPLPDRRGEEPLRFTLELAPEAWRELLETGTTRAPAGRAQYRLARDDGEVVVRNVIAIAARWTPGEDELVLDGELGPASGLPGVDPAPDLTGVAPSASFTARWRVLTTCRVVEDGVSRDDPLLQSPPCRSLIERAGLGRCLEEGACL